MAVVYVFFLRAGNAEERSACLISRIKNLDVRIADKLMKQLL
jgi:hypothetical protein